MQKGRKHDAARIEKNRLGHIGHRHSAATLAKMSAIQGARQASPEFRQKMRATLLLKWRDPKYRANCAAGITRGRLRRADDV